MPCFRYMIIKLISLSYKCAENAILFSYNHYEQTQVHCNDDLHNNDDTTVYYNKNQILTYALYNFFSNKI